MSDTGSVKEGIQQLPSSTHQSPTPVLASADSGTPLANASGDSATLPVRTPAQQPARSTTAGRDAEDDKEMMVTLRIGSKPWKDVEGQKFGVDDDFLYCRGGVTGEATGAYFERHGLEPAEYKFVERTFVNHVINNLGVDFVAKTEDKVRFLVRKDGAVQQAITTHGKKKAAIVTVYEGRSYHPEWDDAKFEEIDKCTLRELRYELEFKLYNCADEQKPGFAEQLKAVKKRYNLLTDERHYQVEALNTPVWKRIYLPANHASGLRYRWTRVEIIDQDPDFANTNQLVDRLDWANEHLGPHREHNTQLYYIDLELETDQYNLQSLLRRVQRAESVGEANYEYEAVRSLLRAQFKGDSDDVAVHANKFFDANKLFDASGSASTPMAGVIHVAGAHQSLRLNQSGEPLMKSGACTNLFFPKGSVADFALTYLGNDPRQELMETALRGKTVLFDLTTNGITTTERKVVCGVSRDTSETAGAAQKHKAWTPEVSRSLQHVTLQCLNVGRLLYPKLMPAELCRFAPMQSFTRPYTANLHHELYLHNTDPTISKERRVKVGDTVFKSFAEEPSTKQEDKNSDVPAMALPAVTNTLDAQLKAAFPKGPRILFVEAASKPVESAAWKSFCLKLCENGIFERNGMKIDCVAPLFLQYDSGRESRAQWAAQLQGFTETHAKGINAKDDGRKMVLVIGVRGTGEDRKKIYRKLKAICEVKLDVQSFFVVLDHLEKKVEKEPKKGAAQMGSDVIRRMRIRNPPPMPPPTDRSDPMDLAIALHVTRVNVNVQKVQKDGTTKPLKEVFLVTLVARDMNEAKHYKTQVTLHGADEIYKEGEKPQGSTRDHIVTKLVEFCDGILPKLPDGAPKHRVTIFRSGYTPHETESHHSAKGSQCPESSVTTMWEKGAVAHLSKRAEKTPSRDRSATAKAIENAKALYVRFECNIMAAKLNNAVSCILIGEDASTIFTRQAETLGDDVGEDINPSVKRIKGEVFDSSDNRIFLKTPKKLMVLTLLGTRNGAKPKAAPTRNELDRLPNIWRDDYLQLHETTLPIPTHLALLAAKRARDHLSLDKYDDVEGMTAPYSLHKVGDRVNDTLYYL
ncbi:hypothetical protein LTR85_002304 [Meristemomyces frigidus]|nr:hypothetical protein LTR85_002304 [Meristemomyces frigidus]